MFLFVGKDLTKIWPEMMARLSPGEIPSFDLAREPRKLLWIAPGRGGAKVDGLAIQTLDTADLHATLAGLRARIGGQAGQWRPRPRCASSTNSRTVLKGARFGVAVWGGDELDSLSIEMLHGLILDLNKTTRFTGLPLGADANAAGVVQTSGWMTGFPVRTSFGRGFPEHDTWRFDATRLIESGEADAALWISAYDREAPPWKKAHSARRARRAANHLRAGAAGLHRGRLPGRRS